MKAAHVPMSKCSLILATLSWKNVEKSLGRHSTETLVGRGSAIFLSKSFSATLKSCLQFMHLAILELNYPDFALGTILVICSFAYIYISLSTVNNCRGYKEYRATALWYQVISASSNITWYHKAVAWYSVYYVNFSKAYPSKLKKGILLKSVCLTRL